VKSGVHFHVLLAYLGLGLGNIVIPRVACGQDVMLLSLPFFALPTIRTPADPLRMLVVALPACLELATGVALAPFLRVA
jgi:hypothetical protein